MRHLKLFLFFHFRGLENKWLKQWKREQLWKFKEQWEKCLKRNDNRTVYNEKQLLGIVSWTIRLSNGSNNFNFNVAYN